MEFNIPVYGSNKDIIISPLLAKEALLLIFAEFTRLGDSTSDLSLIFTTSGESSAGFVPGSSAHSLGCNSSVLLVDDLLQLQHNVRILFTLYWDVSYLCDLVCKIPAVSFGIFTCKRQC